MNARRPIFLLMPLLVGGTGCFPDNFANFPDEGAGVQDVAGPDPVEHVGGASDSADRGPDDTLGETSADGSSTPPPECEIDADCASENLCLVGATCAEGRCVAGTPRTCPPPAPCEGQGLCDPMTGECVYDPRPDGVECDDGDRCTSSDTCGGGLCEGLPEPAGYGFRHTTMSFQAERGVELDALHGTADGRVFGLLRTSSDELRVLSDESFENASTTRPDGAVQTVFLVDVTDVRPSTSTAAALAWTDAPTATLVAAPFIADTSDRQLAFALTFDEPFLARGAGVVGTPPAEDPTSPGVALLRARRNGDVLHHVSWHFGSAAEAMPVVAGVRSEHLVVLHHPGGETIHVSAPATALPPIEAAAHAALIELRAADGALRFRRRLSVEGDRRDELVAIVGAASTADEILLVGATSGALTLSDEAGGVLATIPTGLGAFDGFVLRLRPDGSLVAWQALDAGPDRFAAVSGITHTEGGAVISVSANGPLRARQDATGLGEAIGDTTPPSDGPFRLTLLRLDPSGAVEVLDALEGPEGLTGGPLAGRDGLLAFGAALDPSEPVAELGEIAVPAHALLLADGLRRELAVVARGPEPEPYDPNDPYVDEPLSPVGVVGGPRLAIAGGAVVMAGLFEGEVILGHRGVRRATSFTDTPSVYVLLPDADIHLAAGSLLCRSVWN